MANRRYTSQFLYQFEAMPVKLSCNFSVLASNASGITGLKGEGIKNVFMHTSTTPAAGNPNPESGIIYVQLQDNYSRLLGFDCNIAAPADGSSQTSTTAGRASIISVLGTATLAQWQAKGLPVGVTPALGVCFIATASGSIGGSGAVQRPSSSGIVAVEACGVPNQSIALSSSAVNGGSILVFESLAASAAAPLLTMASYTPAGTNDGASPPIFTGTPAVLTGTISAPALSLGRAAPVDGSVIYLDLWLSNSSVVVAGQ